MMLMFMWSLKKVVINSKKTFQQKNLQKTENRVQFVNDCANYINRSKRSDRARRSAKNVGCDIFFWLMHFGLFCLITNNSCDKTVREPKYHHKYQSRKQDPQQTEFTVTAVRRHCTDWYEIWALTDHEIFYIKIEMDLRKFSIGPFSETEKGF